MDAGGLGHGNLIEEVPAVLCGQDMAIREEVECNGQALEGTEEPVDLFLLDVHLMDHLAAIEICDKGAVAADRIVHTAILCNGSRYAIDVPASAGDELYVLPGCLFEQGAVCIRYGLVC